MEKKASALLQACSETIHNDPDGAGSIASILARVASLEDHIGADVPEVGRAKEILAQWEADEAAAAAKAAKAKK